jgi:hypothetical protein
MRPVFVLACAAFAIETPALAGPLDWLVGKWCTPL